MGRDQEALAALDKALALKPGQPEALNSRGMVAEGAGPAAGSAGKPGGRLGTGACLCGSLEQSGVALRALGRFEDALASIDRALALEPAIFGCSSTAAWCAAIWVVAGRPPMRSGAF